MARIVAKGLIKAMDSFALTESEPRHVSVLSFWQQTAVYDHMAVSDHNASNETPPALDSVRAKLSMVSTKPFATIRHMTTNI